MSIQPTFQQVGMFSFASLPSGLHAWSDQQLRVIHTLRQDEQAERVYWYRALGFDQFIVLVEQDTVETTEHFVDVYLNVLEADLEYRFEIDILSLDALSLLPQEAIPCW